MRILTVFCYDFIKQERKNKRTCEVSAAGSRAPPAKVRFRRLLKFSSSQIIRRRVSGRKAHAPQPAARSLLSHSLALGMYAASLPNRSGKKSALEKQTVAAGRVKQSAARSRNSDTRILCFASPTICSGRPVFWILMPAVTTGVSLLLKQLSKQNIAVYFYRMAKYPNNGKVLLASLVRTH